MKRVIYLSAAAAASLLVAACDTGSGIVTRILAFLASLLGASLPLTGYWLWIRRLAARGRVHHH